MFNSIHKIFIQVSPHVLPIILPLAQVSLTCSIFMTMSLSMERFLVVSNPQHKVSNRISSDIHVHETS